MPRFAANLTFLFNEVPFLERFGEAAHAGFRAVEFAFPYDYRIAEVAAQQREHRLEVVLINAPAGDWAAPLLAAFSDAGVGVAGGWGVRSGNGRQFDDAPPGEVDAVEGYCLAVRRQVLREAGLFDRRFRWYRNADLDFSFQARAAGWRAVRTAALPFDRHEHRGYAAFEEPELTRQSKRNFYRFLKRWGDRRDLLLEPEAEHHHHDHDHA